jgi:Flp pilus assembly pilin Flp
MLRLLNSKKAQTTAEYAILIGLVVAALLAMQTYVKRGLNAKMRDATDTYATTIGLGGTTQYEPYYFGQTLTSGQTGSETKTLATGGGETHASDLTSTRGGTTEIGPTE